MAVAWTQGPGRQRLGGRDRARSRRRRRHAAALPDMSATSRASSSTSTMSRARRRLHRRRSTCDGPVVAAGSATRSDRQARRRRRARPCRIPVTAAGVGVATLRPAAAPDRASTRRRRFTLARPAAARRASTAARCGRCAPGATSRSRRTCWPISCPAPARSRSRLRPMPGIDVPALLQALDRYPYGCSEQIVSRAHAAALRQPARLDARRWRSTTRSTTASATPSTACCRARIRPAASACGRSTTATDIWLDSYVTDFLTRARERGFAVPQKALDIALDRLRNAVANAPDVPRARARTSPMRSMCWPATAAR